jgi:hypothetical protein
MMVVAIVLLPETSRDWSQIIPAAMLLGVAVQYVLHVRQARAAARLLPRYLEASCAEAAALARSTS